MWPSCISRHVDLTMYNLQKKCYVTFQYFVLEQLRHVDLTICNLQ